MKITATKVIRELEENHGWKDIKSHPFLEDLVRDMLKVVDKELIKHKNISIK